MRRIFLLLSVICLMLAGAFLTYSISASAQTGATPTPYPLPTWLPLPTAPPVTPAPIPNPLPEVTPIWQHGELLAETDHFLIHANDGYFPADVERFARDAEEVYDYVSARVGITAREKIGVLFARPRPAPCPETGYTDRPTPGFEATIVIFADETTSRTQIMGVLAREVGRVLLRNQSWRLSETSYALGYPVWAAGRYWHAWQESPSFDESVRAYLERSQYLSLREHYGFGAILALGCTERNEILPTEWASFIDFLLSEYGAEKFEALLRSPKSEPVETDEGHASYDIPADYQDVYGLELNQLEAQWLEHLTVNAPQTRRSATPTPYPLPTEAIPLDQPVFIEAPDGRTVTITRIDPPVGDSQSREQFYGELVAGTDHFLIHASEGYFPVDVPEQFAHDAEEVYDYVSARLEVTSDEKTIILFEGPDSNVCPVRGLAIVSPPSDPYAGDYPPEIVIYADENTSHKQIMGVLAHELGHVLTLRNSEQRWIPHETGHQEGLATWAAGRYWHAWQGTTSFSDSVRSYIEQSKYLSLREHYDFEPAYSRENCIEKRNILYTEWASFIEFLLTEYGYERLETLFRSPKSEEVEADEGRMFYVTPADYQSVYGLELNQLEAQWLEHLMDEAEVTRTPRRRVCPMCIEGESLPASVPAVPSAP